MVGTIPSKGVHRNTRFSLSRYIKRIEKGNTYKDESNKCKEG